MALPIFSSQPRHVIAIASGKGGVGKSTVAVNLAGALQIEGARVGLLDADIYGPSVGRMLPLDEGVRRRGETIEPGLARGIAVLSLAHFRKDESPAAVRAPIANGIVTQFIRQVDWSGLDYLIVDFPPGTGDIQLTLCQELRFTGALLVTTPQEIALLDVRKSAALFEQVGVPVLGVVENMSYLPVGEERYTPFGSGGGERLAQERGVPLLAQHPLDPQLAAWSDEGRMAVFADREAPVSKIFLQLAEKVEKMKSIEGPRIERNGEEFTLIWSDGERVDLVPSEVQAACPCAGCREQPPQIDPDVKIVEIVPVGLYAVKIVFSSGCSSGIYTCEEVAHALV